MTVLLMVFPPTCASTAASTSRTSMLAAMVTVNNAVKQQIEGRCCVQMGKKGLAGEGERERETESILENWAANEPCAYTLACATDLTEERRAKKQKRGEREEEPGYSQRERKRDEKDEPEDAARKETR